MWNWTHYLGGGDPHHSQGSPQDRLLSRSLMPNYSQDRADWGAYTGPSTAKSTWRFTKVFYLNTLCCARVTLRVSDAAAKHRPVLAGWCCPGGNLWKAAAGNSSSSGRRADGYERLHPVVCHSMSVPTGCAGQHWFASLNNSEIHVGKL